MRTATVSMIATTMPITTVIGMDISDTTTVITAGTIITAAMGTTTAMIAAGATETTIGIMIGIGVTGVIAIADKQYG